MLDPERFCPVCEHVWGVTEEICPDCGLDPVHDVEDRERYEAAIQKFKEMKDG